MVESSRPSLQIDLNEFKLHLHLRGRIPLTFHFNSPSRSFYLSLIALVVNEMKKSGKIKSIPLQDHLDLLALLNETVGGAAGSSDKENLLPRIYKKWKDALPNLEEAPLFKVLGKKKKEEGDGSIGKVYSFSDEEKDGWANLFDYMGSEENVRLKFATDKIGVGLNDTSMIFGDFRDEEAWDQFINSLGKKEKKETAPAEEASVSEPPGVLISLPQEPKISWFSRYRWALLILVMGVGAGVVGKIFWSPARIEVASVERMQYPLPESPSIAVLPFVNMSDDPKQEFLCDGMTEEIITALTRVPRLFVIARNSSFTYKGRAVKVKQVSEELGVRYVLEGSVRRSGDRIRVSVQLVDALTGHHLWAERYDRDLKDLFALQDEITLKVLQGVQTKLIYGGKTSLTEKYFRGEKGLDCYLKLMNARATWQRRSAENNNRARGMIEELLAECPDNPWVYLNLGWVYYQDNMLDKTKPLRETLDKAIELAQKVIAMDDSIADPHVLMSFCYYLKKEFAKALAEGEKAVSLNPNLISALNAYAFSLNLVGRPDEAIPIYQKATRLSPFGPPSLYRDFGYVLRDAGRFNEAVSEFKKAIQIDPEDVTIHYGLAGAYIMLGHWKEARAEAAEILRIDPTFKMSYLAWSFQNKNLSEAEKIEIILRETGLFALYRHAGTLRSTGRYEKAIPIYQRAISLSPAGPSYLYSSLGSAFHLAGRLEEAVSAFKKAIHIGSDDLSAHTGLTATYVLMGREKEARAGAAEVLRINPKFSIDFWAENLPYRDQTQKEKIVNALRKAGLK